MLTGPRSIAASVLLMLSLAGCGTAEEQAVVAERPAPDPRDGSSSEPTSTTRGEPGSVRLDAPGFTVVQDPETITDPYGDTHYITYYGDGEGTRVAVSAITGRSVEEQLSTNNAERRDLGSNARGDQLIQTLLPDPHVSVYFEANSNTTIWLSSAGIEPVSLVELSNHVQWGA